MGLASVVTVAVFAYAGLGLYSVESDESAVAFRCGRVVAADVLPGVHWNTPWPFGRVVVEPTATNFTMPVGYRLQRRAGVEPISDLWLTGDTNVITARLRIQYRISSLTSFVLAHEFPREVVRRAGERVVTRFLLSEGVDGILTSQRASLLAAVKREAQEHLDELGTGVEIQSVSIDELAPSAQGGVRGAFQDVQNAILDKQRMIHEANATAAQTLAEARAESERIVNLAKADRHQRIESARGESTRFLALAYEHKQAPHIMEERLYLETIEKVLPLIETFIVEPGPEGNVNLRVFR